MARQGTARKIGALTIEVVGILENIRQEKGLTHVWLASNTGIPRSSITKILAGNMVLDLDQLQKIAESMGQSASVITAEAERKLAGYPLDVTTDWSGLPAPPWKLAAKNPGYSIQDQLEGEEANQP